MYKGGGYSAKNQKPSHWGSVSVNETQGVFDFDRGDKGRVGYTVVEELGGGKQAAHEGGWIGLPTKG